MSCRASSWQAHWQRLRLSISGRAQASRTTGIATSGGTPPFGPAARGVSEAIHTLGEKAFGPLADHGAWHAHGLRHSGLGRPCRPEQENLPPPGQS
jgi:hypothetical protein